MERIAELDSILLVHAEDPTKLAEPKGPTARDFIASRPWEAELSAIHHAIMLSRETGCRLHIVHVSTVPGIALIQDAQLRGDDLLAMLAAGEVEMVVSDHSPSTLDLKEGDDFARIWGGISGCQSTRQLLLAKAKLELSVIAAVTATNVARRFRLPKKGDIAPGFDADLWIVDLREEDVVRGEDLLYRNRFSAHEGQRIRGKTVKTLLRGGEPSRGEVIRPDAGS
jgi:allantoinase